MYLSDKLCVISANNTVTKDGELVDYIRLASIAAERVKHFLDLDTCLITNDLAKANEYPIFKHILEGNSSKVSKRIVPVDDGILYYEWLNDSRVDAFDLTKGLAKKILMIDADYMVASDILKIWLDTDYPFHIFDQVIDIGDEEIFPKYYPSQDIVHRWATAICWDQSEEAKAIFETAKMVRNNYEFYATMFGMYKNIFRNDLAFSIACHLLEIPVNETQTLWNLMPKANINFSKNRWILSYEKNIISWYNDIHVLNKKYAMDYEFMDQLRLPNDQEI